ncbi:MAG: hypothetical protein ACOYMF_15170 [Bacteroidales bacterium]
MNNSRNSYLINIWFLVVFLGIALYSNAQENNGCLTEFQLLKMQKTSLGDIRVFLAGEGWELTGAQAEPSLQSNIVKWQNANYNNRGNLLLCFHEGKSNIVIFQTSKSCFQQVLQSLDAIKTGDTRVSDNILITSFYRNGIAVEFQECLGNYSADKYSVIIYTTSNSNTIFLKEFIISQNLEREIQVTDYNANKMSRTAYQDQNSQSQAGVSSDIYSIASDKAYFYSEATYSTVTSSFLIKGQKIKSNKVHNGFVFTSFSYKGRTTVGWLSLNDLRKE